jgi:glutamate racemase
MDVRPIGVFDSGIGGLTVLHALRERLPQESFIYLGDTARVPYGTKGAATVRRFTLQAARYLVSQGVKRLVIACNTASSLALDALQESCPVPVQGVIEPGVEAALAATRGYVGVIGTLATIASDRYGELLRAARPALRVDSKACPLFVPLAEEGWLEGDVPRAVARDYLQAMRDSGVDTMILGCTHYPLLKTAIAAAMGPHVTLVDSALVLADSVAKDLEKTSELSPGPGSLRLVVTDVPQRFAEVGERFLQRVLPQVEVVTLEDEYHVDHAADFGARSEPAEGQGTGPREGRAAGQGRGQREGQAAGRGAGAKRARRLGSVSGKDRR